MKLEDVILRDTRANQPNVNTVAVGTLYSVTDEDFIIEQSDGNNWLQYSPSAGAGINQLTGDVTAGPGTGSVAATIVNDAVTYAKMQNISAASRLLGRGSAAGAGNTEEITLSGLSMVGTVLTVTPAWTSIFKAASTTRTNDGVPSADPDLQFAMLANKTYAFRATVMWISTAAADFEYGFAGPAAPTRVSLKRSHIPSGSVTQTNAVDNAYDASTTVTATVNEYGWVTFEGSIQNGANAGNFEFLWSSNTAVPLEDTTVLAGSWLEYRQVD